MEVLAIGRRDFLRWTWKTMMMAAMRRNEAWAAAMLQSRDQLLALKAQTLASLLALPPYSFEARTLGAYEARYAVYKDVSEDGSVRLVVQVMMPRRWLFGDTGISTVFADGFRVYPDGEVASLAQEELYDFM
jgi:hypothetical protein